MKKVLVISYYWPPAGGISVLRTLKIVKYLRNFGWEPIVYAPSNAHYPYLDKDNLKDIPNGIKIIKRPVTEPFIVFKLLTGRKKSQPLNSIVQVRDKKPSIIDQLSIWIRGNFFIPDARSFWINPSVRFLKKYLETHPVDALLTDGPPHTNTYIANLLKKKTGTPWLSDYQDPWTQVDYYDMMMIGKRADKIHKRMEQECFSNSNKITIASPSWKDDLQSIGAKNVDVIYYGYDEDDFQNLTKKESDYFNIVHIGLLGIDRHPYELFEVLNKLKNKRIRLQLAGQIDVVVEKHLSQLNNVMIDIMGTIPRKEALRLAMDADLLLLPLNKADNAKGRLPGKLYEYLRTYNPILSLGPKNSDAAKIISNTQTGYCIEYENAQAQHDLIIDLIEGNIHPQPDRQKISEFSNKNQTKKIAAYLDEMI